MFQTFVREQFRGENLTTYIISHDLYLYRAPLIMELQFKVKDFLVLKSASDTTCTIKS